MTQTIQQRPRRALLVEEAMKMPVQATPAHEDIPTTAAAPVARVDARRAQLFDPSILERAQAATARQSVPLFDAQNPMPVPEARPMFDATTQSPSARRPLFDENQLPRLTMQPQPVVAPDPTEQTRARVVDPYQHDVDDYTRLKGQRAENRNGRFDWKEAIGNALAGIADEHKRGGSWGEMLGAGAGSTLGGFVNPAAGEQREQDALVGRLGERIETQAGFRNAEFARAAKERELGIKEDQTAQTGDYRNAQIEGLGRRLDIQEALGMGRLGQGERKLDQSDVKLDQGQQGIDERGRHNVATEGEAARRTKIMERAQKSREALGQAGIKIAQGRLAVAQGQLSVAQQRVKQQAEASAREAEAKGKVAAISIARLKVEAKKALMKDEEYANLLVESGVQIIK